MNDHDDYNYKSSKSDSHHFCIDDFRYSCFSCSSFLFMFYFPFLIVLKTSLIWNSYIELSCLFRISWETDTESVNLQRKDWKTNQKLRIKKAVVFEL
jgi:hypothetical protein